MNLSDIIFLVFYLPLWFALVRRDTQMFQQNSYRMARYARWYRQGHDTNRAVMTAAFAVVSLLTFIPRIEVCCVFMLFAARAELRTVYKKPIVYTMRVRRLFFTAALLTALGGQVEELPEGLRIRGVPQLRGGTVDCCGDHRIAMSAAAAACICREPVTVCGSECVSKSYPDFWVHYAALKGASL